MKNHLLGIVTIPANKDVTVGIETVRIKLIGTGGVPTLFVYNNCIETIKEFKRYTWKKVAKNPLNPTNEPDEPLKKDDHLADAWRYVIHSEHKGRMMPWKGVTVKPKENRFLANDKRR